MVTEPLMLTVASPSMSVAVGTLMLKKACLAVLVPSKTAGLAKAEVVAVLATLIVVPAVKVVTGSRSCSVVARVGLACVTVPTPHRQLTPVLRVLARILVVVTVTVPVPPMI
jgi:hypothetical protein